MPLHPPTSLYCGLEWGSKNLIPLTRAEGATRPLLFLGESMHRFRFHVVALPHTWTAMSHSACAFTMKILHFCQMMHSLGHEVVHYGVEGSDVAECTTEHVQVLSRAEQESFFGKYNPDALYEVDWSGRAPYWGLLNARTADAINARKRPGDFVCVIMGSLNLPLITAVEGDVAIVEYGIGYNGCLPRQRGRYRVYESYAHMHKIMGR